MKPEVPEVSAEDAFARSASGEAVIVDVRESDEWEAGHIPGALHIPLAELEARWPELRASDSVIAVCRSGNRSATATQALRSVGIDAANLSGGVKAWAGAELPLHAPNARVA
ncbi:MAG: rhodanese-like domain-containing protein [Gaiellaceae bacterium]